MSRLYDFVKETTTTVGTGAYSLDGASGSFRAFNVVPDGATAAYACQQLTVVGGVITGGEREVGLGVYNAALNELSRATILSSTNGGAAVVWGSGTKDIFITTPAALIPLLLAPIAGGDAGKALVVGAGGVGVDLLANVLSLGAALAGGDANKFIKVNGAGTGIVPVAVADPWSTGDVKLTLKNVADVGWVLMKDRTIGNAASGATERANADTQALFALLWNNISDTYAPVSTGRGADAASDFAANKTIKLLAAVGRAIGLAGAGAGAGLTTRSLGENLGAETHPLTAAENAAHNHDPIRTGAGNTSSIVYSESLATSQINAAFRTSGHLTSSGSGTPHNTMQPSVFLNAMMKL